MIAKCFYSRPQVVAQRQARSAAIAPRRAPVRATVFALLLLSSAGVIPPAMAQARVGADSPSTTIRGSTQLEQEQRTERERAAPLGRRERRDFDRRERGERNDLRAAEQRAWRERARRRPPPLGPRPHLQTPTDRYLERQRLQRRLQRSIERADRRR